MVSPNAIRTALGILGNIISFVLFLSPVPTFVQIWKKGSVEQFSAVPYLATFGNCMLWVLYGVPVVHENSILVLTINGIGCLIEVSYLVLFVLYSDKKRRVMVLLISLVEVIFVGILAALVLTLAHTLKMRSLVVGILCIIFNILMYASPLSVMKMVITTKSVEYMPFSLSLAAFCNGLCWTAYALIPFDPFVAVPNGLGTLFGLAQLILYATFYKSTKRQVAERERKGQVGLTEVVVEKAESNKISNEHPNGRVAERNGK
ncbi:SWEET sugar transporter [Dillenia turbinata]|uniref:Bidirectional sugar transporter SWEET n=1 Tax=Dillenia turbinata TaxID=194707 RepID=A0AAN8WKP0_9MAGN